MKKNPTAFYAVPEQLHVVSQECCRPVTSGCQQKGKGLDLVSRKLVAVSVVVLVVMVAAGVGYLFLTPRTPAEGGTVSYTTARQTSSSSSGQPSTTSTLTLPSSWTVFPDASSDLVDKNGKVVGDLGQPYADVTSVSGGVYDGAIFFRFVLHGPIPNNVSDTRVTIVEYQVLLDADQNPNTGYQGWRTELNYAPDHILLYQVSFDNPTRTAQTQLQLLKYSGDGKSWNWTPIEGSLMVEGGVGQDFVVITCRFQDLSLPSSGPSVDFIGRSMLVYDGETYNDPTYGKPSGS